MPRVDALIAVQDCSSMAKPLASTIAISSRLALARSTPRGARPSPRPDAIMRSWIWGSNVAVTVVFLDFIRLLGPAGTFLLFAVLTVGGLAIAWALVPET